MAVKRIVLLIGVLLVAGRASAQPFPNGSVPAHVICDSGCAGSGGATTVEQSDPTKLQATMTNANLDIALSALRDALRGASAKTLTDVVNALTALSVSITGTVTVTGPLTDTQLRASAVPVSLATAPTTAVTNTSLDGTTLGSIKTDLDKIPTSPAQESGNLATIATNSGTQATAANQTTGNSSLTTIATNTTNVAGAIDQPGTTSPTYVMVDGATDLNGMTRAVLADPSGSPLVISRPAVPPALLFPCNALRRLNCR